MRTHRRRVLRPPGGVALALDRMRERERAPAGTSGKRSRRTRAGREVSPRGRWEGGCSAGQHGTHPPGAGLGQRRAAADRAELEQRRAAADRTLRAGRRVSRTSCLPPTPCIVRQTRHNASRQTFQRMSVQFSKGGIQATLGSQCWRHCAWGEAPPTGRPFVGARLQAG